jgi:hypothetical protein
MGHENCLPCPRGDLPRRRWAGAYPDAPTASPAVCARCGGRDRLGAQPLRLRQLREDSVAMHARRPGAALSVCDRRRMADNAPGIAATQHPALLTHRIVVLEDAIDGGQRRVIVAGAPEERVEEIVRQELGDDVEVEVWAPLPRQLLPLRCVGHMEREPGRLQLRFVLRGDQHVDDIVIAEDDGRVVVFATVCTPVLGEDEPAYEGPWHVYLDGPLGERTVIDGSSGTRVPYKNVYEELRRDGAE